MGLGRQKEAKLSIHGDDWDYEKKNIENTVDVGREG